MLRHEQAQWLPSNGWLPRLGEKLSASAGLVFAFGSRHLLAQAERIQEMRLAYPGALLLGCSTAGEIRGDEVADESLVATALAFENTRVVGACVSVSAAEDSERAGRELAGQLDPSGLRHVIVLSEGLHVNGTDLVQGLTEGLPAEVGVTGGLSADGSHFESTAVLYNDRVSSGLVAAAAFYGDSIRVGCGSLGGWDSFGPERIITRSRGSVLYELDGKPALGLYKQYLGDYARELPASGLLFPLAIRAADDDATIVRTILSVCEDEGSLTFAGDVPEGYHARLMKANFDRLVDGAVGAARNSLVPGAAPEFALLISCVGRKLLLKQRVEEEIEGVRDVLGAKPCFAGFYSYGEISPFSTGTRCELHNQTMTITMISEAVAG